MWLENYYDLLDYLEIEDFDGLILSVGYTNAEDEYNEFDITDIRESSYYGDEYIEAYCINKDGESEEIERTFKICRFNSIEIISEYDD